MFNFDVKEINSPCNLPWQYTFFLNFFWLILLTTGKTRVKSLSCNLRNLAICRLLRGFSPVLCCFSYVNLSQVEFFATYQVANVCFPQTGNLVICRFLYIDYSQTDSFGTFQSVKALFLTCYIFQELVLTFFVLPSVFLTKTAYQVIGNLVIYLSHLFTKLAFFEFSFFQTMQLFLQWLTKINGYTDLFSAGYGYTVHHVEEDPFPTDLPLLSTYIVSDNLFFRTLDMESIVSTGSGSETVPPPPPAASSSGLPAAEPEKDMSVSMDTGLPDTGLLDESQGDEVIKNLSVYKIRDLRWLTFRTKQIFDSCYTLAWLPPFL